MNTTVKLPTKEAIAAKFVELLRSVIDDKSDDGLDWYRMQKANAEETSQKKVCHSHDYCDANMVMDAAWRELGVKGGCRPENQEHADLWNAAWEAAMPALGRGMKPYTVNAEYHATYYNVVTVMARTPEGACEVGIEHANMGSSWKSYDDCGQTYVGALREGEHDSAYNFDAQGRPGEQVAIPYAHTESALHPAGPALAALRDLYDFMMAMRDDREKAHHCDTDALIRKAAAVLKDAGLIGAPVEQARAGIIEAMGGPKVDERRAFVEEQEAEEEAKIQAYLEGFAPGERIVLTRAWECDRMVVGALTIPEGATGAFVQNIDEGSVSIKLDQHYPELDEWKNCLHIWSEPGLPMIIRRAS